MNNDSELLKYFDSEYQKPFSGWDFSYIQNRIRHDKTSWSYEDTVFHETRNIERLLDMGTGGGEFLSRLAPLPKHTYATEAYEPNIPIATKRLKPLGVKVVGIKNDTSLPLESDYFNLVINSHESYSESEVFRILKKGSRFITQQVGGENDLGLNRILGDHSGGQYPHWKLDFAVEQLIKHRFTIIEQKEEFPVAKFKDVGAIIYYLKAVPWQLKDFSIKAHFEGLKRIKEQIEVEGYFEINAHRFFIIAEKN